MKRIRTNEAGARDEAESPVRIPAPPVVLDGRLALPAGAGGVVLFAHGSGSSRLSPRNRYVADVLHRGGVGTLLFDLLTGARGWFAAHGLLGSGGKSASRGRERRLS